LLGIYVDNLVNCFAVKDFSVVSESIDGLLVWGGRIVLIVIVVIERMFYLSDAIE